MADSLYGDDGGGAAAQPQPQAAAAAGFGHPIYDQIGQLFKQYTGKDANQQQVSQWGTNVDSQYMRKINDAIYNSADAAAYRASQSQPPKTEQAAAAAPAPQQATSPVTSSGGIPPPTATPPPVQPAVAAPTGQAVAQTYSSHLTGAPASALYNAPQLNIQQLASQQPQTSAQTALLMALLQHPESMTDQGVNQLKEQQKEAALSMQQQQLGVLNQGAASRGTFGGGTQAGLQGQQAEATRAQMLNAYRGIDLQKMQQDQQDKLNVLGLSDSIMSGQQNRDINSGNYGLNAQMQQEALRQAASQSSYNAWNSDQQRQMQQDLAHQGYDLDWAKLGETGRQFDQGQNFNWAQLGQQGSIAAGQLGFNYAGLDQASQIAMLRALGYPV